MKNIIKIISSIMIVLHLFTVTAFAVDTVTFYHTDPAGTPLAVSDSSGNIVWKADYKPFGEEQAIEATTENYKMFVGKEKDKETGLYYFGARYLSDRIGRFTSVDPVGPVDEKTGKVNEKMLLNPQKMNRYSYAINNPYRYVDPDGRDVWSIGFGSSYFLGNIGHQARKDQHGVGKQAGFGIAYDTKTGEFFTFGTGGKADSDEGKVLGVNAGVGLFVGQLKGDKQDFLGKSQEESVTPGLFTITSVETESGKKGTTFSFGGKGFGLSYTSITSDTFDLGDTLREIFQRNKDTKKP
ncbi:MAG: RHS repeat-associated core domain-containing protein [Nitrospirota bacterium]